VPSKPGRKGFRSQVLPRRGARGKGRTLHGSVREQPQTGPGTPPKKSSMVRWDARSGNRGRPGDRWDARSGKGTPRLRPSRLLNASAPAKPRPCRPSRLLNASAPARPRPSRPAGLVPVDHPTLHDEVHPLESGNVFGRVSLNGNEISQIALSDNP